MKHGQLYPHNGEDGLPDDVAYNMLEDDARKSVVWHPIKRDWSNSIPSRDVPCLYPIRTDCWVIQFNYQSAWLRMEGSVSAVDRLIAFDPAVQEEKSRFRLFVSSSVCNKGGDHFALTNHPETILISTLRIQIVLPTTRLISNFDSWHYQKLLWPGQPILLSYGTCQQGLGTGCQLVEHLMPNFRPGKCTFRVQTAHGLTSPVVTRSLSIIILPPWWQSII